MTDKSEAETQKELIAAMAKAILRQQEAEKKNDGPTEADREMEHELRKLNPRHQQATIDALTAEVQAKEQEIARLTTLAELGRDSRQMLPLVIDELATLKAPTCHTCALKVEAMSASKLGLIVCSRTDRMENRSFSCGHHTPKEPEK